MTEPENADLHMVDDYDEDADSDFQQGDHLDDDNSTSSSDNEDKPGDHSTAKSRKKTIPQVKSSAPIEELDSGDEATIREQKKGRRKQKTQDGETAKDSGDDSEEWRAKTRAMRQAEKDDRRRNKLATSKGSTIDVNKIWEEMNRPNPPSYLERDNPSENLAPQRLDAGVKDADKENILKPQDEDMITIKRTYKFAGEVHTEEKVVPKSSAEAQLWLAQQSKAPAESLTHDGGLVQRPLRKISRFDPNFSNLAAFKSSWTKQGPSDSTFKGPKLNVVEKSKMDWAQHVDTEGLKEELATHAKAKEGYLSRMDFLSQVEMRKEDEAKIARMKGR
ncbi:hypothetical protein PV10_00832 [Exophiala mesophila]|uniref:SWR1-complex protein 5 n=1 Tax=Exophiala mesophila TaxID=212818 RepID=A0A0D1Y8Q5_EXOME|nr:uncharacterized protein PV10_00832 [Exophiala mesophila]KIV97026.1 hypothetical protein PV10_00832 [Exophiala mesophila]